MIGDERARPCESVAWKVFTLTFLPSAETDKKRNGLQVAINTIQV